MRESEKVQEDRGQGSGEVDGAATQGQSVARGSAAVAGPANPGGQYLQLSVAKKLPTMDRSVREQGQRGK